MSADLRTKRRLVRRLTAMLFAASLGAVACGAAHPVGSAPAADSPFPALDSASAAAICRRTVVAAGDMNGLAPTQATGELAQAQHPDVVAALGDEQYETGALADFRSKYDHTGWGRLKPRTRPVPGNHEYLTPGAAGYFAYFGHPPRYYAYDLGCGWRGYALNSEIGIAGQASWLRRDLAAHPGATVLAYWHRPRYSSGTKHGPDPAVQPFWDALAGRRGIVLNGHEHNYERFAARGTLREFVVGTGGSSTYPFAPQPAAGSVKRIAHTPGVLVLTLADTGGYSWAFHTTARAVLDSGRG